MRRVVSPATIQTIEAVQKARRRADRLHHELARIFEAMRRGESLRRHYQAGYPYWSLSGGRTVSAEAAAIVTKAPEIVGCDEGLLPDHHQSWKIIND